MESSELRRGVCTIWSNCLLWNEGKYMPEVPAFLITLNDVYGAWLRCSYPGHAKTISVVPLKEKKILIRRLPTFS